MRALSSLVRTVPILAAVAASLTATACTPYDPEPILIRQTSPIAS
jgi:hypothetical protein